MPGRKKEGLERGGKKRGSGRVRRGELGNIRRAGARAIGSSVD